MDANDPRLTVGADLLRRIGGADHERGIAGLREFSPSTVELTVAFAFGEVLSRSGLGLRERQCCTIAILLANGSAQAQLKFHMAGLLNVGGGVDDIVELLFLATALVGFPAAIAGADLLRELIAERSIAYRPHAASVPDDRYGRGRESMRRLLAIDPEHYAAAFAEVSPALARWAVEYEFGDVLARDALPATTRQLAAIMMLAARGNRDELLFTHLRGSLAAGLDRTMLEEALIQLAVYAGFPAALNACTIAAAACGAPTDPVGPPPAPSSAPAVISHRRDLGFRTLDASSGEHGAAVVNGFDDIAPDIGRFIVEHSYGDVFSRPGLDAKVRELTTIATLVASMSAVDEKPLGVHVAAALKLGATREEVIEIVLNATQYRGHPAAQRAAKIVGAALDADG